MQASGADNIGAMYGDQVQYCGVYSGANFCNILAEGNEFYGLGSTDPSAWDYGIHVRGSGSTLNLTGNLFNGLRKGLNIFSGTHNVQNFRCNTFVPHTAISTNLPCFGIVVGLEPGNNNLTTARIAGPIGGNGDPNIPNPDPSGNVWPVDPASLAANPISGGPAVINNWQSPQGWTSLRNDNTDPDANLEYWAYNNEFVWPNVNNSLTTFVSRRSTVIGSTQIYIYRIGDPPATFDPNHEYREQCAGTLPDVFPLRMAVGSSNLEITSSNSFDTETGSRALLGDAVPNPAQEKAMIPVYLSEDGATKYKLSIFSLDGKKTILEIPIEGKGSLNTQISLAGFASGVYGYSLSDNGRTLGTRKLVVIK